MYLKNTKGEFTFSTKQYCSGSLSIKVDGIKSPVRISKTEAGIKKEVNEKVAFNHYIVSYNLGYKPAAFDVLRCLKMHIGVEGNNQSKIEEFEKICEELRKSSNAQA